MHDAPRYATLRDYLRVVRQQAVLIVLTTLIVGGIALYASTRDDKVYRAESSIRIRDISNDLQALFGEQVPANLTLGTESSTVAALINSRPLAEGVRDRLTLTVDPDSLRGAVTGQVEVRTGLVVIRARWGDPQFAARLANAYAEEAVERRSEEQRARFRRALDEQLDNRRDLRNPEGLDRVARALNILDLNRTIQRLRSLIATSQPAEIAERADVPGSPISPRPVRDTLLGLLLGLVLGVMFAFLRDVLDRRLRGTAEIRDHLGWPVLATLSHDGLGTVAASANGTKPLPVQDLEAMRILRKNVSFLDIDQPPRVIAVTSALPEEGKSTVASNLALTHALAGRMTLLIECDLRRPSLAHRLGLSKSPGLTDYLVGEAKPEEILQVLTLRRGNREEDSPALVVITAGAHAPRPAELLDSERMRSLLEDVAGAYDAVILDTAPVLPVVDSLALLPHADGVVICARSEQTTRDQATQLRTALANLPPKPTGVVVTNTEPQAEGYAYYEYAYKASGSRS